MQHPETNASSEEQGIMSDPTVKASIRVKGIKINTLVPPASLVGLVPPEPQPAGNPVIDVELEGSPIVLRATLNGKSGLSRTSGKLRRAS
jgi:hypothetical protein